MCAHLSVDVTSTDARTHDMMFKIWVWDHFPICDKTPNKSRIEKQICRRKLGLLAQQQILQITWKLHVSHLATAKLLHCYQIIMMKSDFVPYLFLASPPYDLIITVCAKPFWKRNSQSSVTVAGKTSGHPTSSSIRCIILYNYIIMIIIVFEKG